MGHKYPKTGLLLRHKNPISGYDWDIVVPYIVVVPLTIDTLSNQKGHTQSHLQDYGAKQIFKM